MPAFLVAETEDLASVADCCASRCLTIARTLELGGAVDQSILGYAKNLADGTQALCDALPAGVGDDLTHKVARLHNALDMQDRPGQVAA